MFFADEVRAVLRMRNLFVRNLNKFRRVMLNSKADVPTLADPVRPLATLALLDGVFPVIASRMLSPIHLDGCLTLLLGAMNVFACTRSPQWRSTLSAEWLRPSPIDMTSPSRMLDVA